MATRATKTTTKAKNSKFNVSNFIADAIARGPMSLHDHLVLSGFTQDFNAYRSAKTKIVAAFKSGQFSNVIGSAIFPSPSRGPTPIWALGAQVKADMQGMPAFLGSPQMALVTSKIVHSGLSQTDQARAIAHASLIARSSKKVRTAFVESTVLFADQQTETIIAMAALKEENVELTNRVEQHGAELREVRMFMNRFSADTTVPAKV